MVLTDGVFADLGVDVAMDPNARTFREAVTVQIRHQLDVSRDETRLDVVVPDLIARAARAVPDADEKLSAAINAIIAAARSRACAGCCQSGGVCYGVRGDDALVAEGGRCMSEFKDADRQAAAIAKHYYEMHSTLFKKAPPPAIVFSSAAVATAPHSHAAMQLGVGANTSFHQGTEGPSSEIGLKVHVPSLNRFSMSATPYILLHEHLCHAFQYIYPTTQSRADQQDWDTFSEGWMDHVVVGVMDHVRRGLGPEGATFDFEQLRAAQQVHLHRSNDGLIDRLPTTARVKMGARAATEVETALRSMFGADRGWAAFLGLSFDLNVMNQTPTERHALVVKVLLHLTTPAGRKVDLLAALAGYAHDADVGRFIAALNFA